MRLLGIPIVDYRVIEPEGLRHRELEDVLKDLGSKGFEIVCTIPRSMEGSARLILSRRVASRMPGDTN